MAILNRFLHFLEWMEQTAHTLDAIAEPPTVAWIICILSYFALLLNAQDGCSAALLSGVTVWALYPILNRPQL